MCDTHVLKKDNVVFFAKNSDREPDEAQLVVRIPSVENDTTRKLKTTYIEIDQSPNRHSVLLSKPFWIWGAEMGANDRGVVIGNEAVYTSLIDKTDGLIGMDLLRLGLERGDTAEHAMHVIIELLHKHGQGGVCGFRDRHMRYDNSFIIADSEQAWILETAGRHWVAKKVKTFGAISNCLTIGEDYDLKSDSLEDIAKKKGFFSGKGDFNFKKTFDTRFIPYFAASRHRLASGNHCLQETSHDEHAHVQQMMYNLRTHYEQDSSPATGTNRDLCMHAGGFIRRSQTCGSMVSRLSETVNSHFFTGTSAPCLSIFKPATFEIDVKCCVINPDDKTVDGSIWQKNEHIHRRIIFMDEERQKLQESIAHTENEMLSIFEQSDFQMSDKAFKIADGIINNWFKLWYEKYRNQAIYYPSMSMYGRFWRKTNEVDGLLNR